MVTLAVAFGGTISLDHFDDFFNLLLSWLVLLAFHIKFEFGNP